MVWNTRKRRYTRYTGPRKRINYGSKYGVKKIRMARGGSNRNRAYGSGSYNSNTYQRQNTIVYKRNKLSRAKRRYLKKSYKRNLLNDLKLRPQNKFIFTTTTDISFLQNSYNSSVGIAVNTGYQDNQANNPNNDLQEINKKLFGGTLVSVDTNNTFFIDNAQIEVSINLNPTISSYVEVDVYSVYCKKNIEQSILGCYQLGFTELGTSTETPKSTTQQITPFDQNFFGSYYTIYKVQRIQLNRLEGNISWNKRNNRNIKINTAELTSISLGKVTWGFLLIFRRKDKANNLDIGTLQTRRTYNIKVIESATNKVYVNPN